MRPPVPFNWALDALNGDQEFDPKAVVSERLSTTPEGQKHVEFSTPYWFQLRNRDYMTKMMRTLDAKPVTLSEPREAIALTTRLNSLPASFTPSSEAKYRKVQDEFVRTLRDLVEKWHDSGWNLAQCFRSNPSMQSSIERLLRRQPLALLPSSDPGPSVLVNPFAPTTPFTVRRNRRGKSDHMANAREDARTLFIRLAQHPGCSRLGKCVRCGRYFYGRSGQKCCPRPRRCGSYLAAIRATKANWRQARKTLIDMAQQEVARWETEGVRTPWKTWVARRVKKTEKWITRAINRGELTPPRVVYKSD
jgi:hypothetical protein